MNAITKALSEIRFAIPSEVLNIAFMERSPRINQVISLDERILNSILRPKVLVDLNLVGGITTKIDLNYCSIKELATREFIIEVPKNLTNGKSIVSLLSLVSNVLYSQTMPTIGASPVMSSAINMMNNLGTENIIQTSKLELVGENVVLVQDPTAPLYSGILRCNVENNTNLENINPRAYLTFAELCILAVKSYVWTNAKIKLDQGYIYGGHELGSVTEIIDGYADAREMYNEFLKTKWSKVAFLNNSDNSSRYIVSMLGNTL